MLALDRLIYEDTSLQTLENALSILAEKKTQCYWQRMTFEAKLETVEANEGYIDTAVALITKKKEMLFQAEESKEPK